MHPVIFFKLNENLIIRGAFPTVYHWFSCYSLVQHLADDGSPRIPRPEWEKTENLLLFIPVFKSPMLQIGQDNNGIFRDVFIFDSFIIWSESAVKPHLWLALFPGPQYFNLYCSKIKERWVKHYSILNLSSFIISYIMKQSARLWQSTTVKKQVRFKEHPNIARIVHRIVCWFYQYFESLI